jgi:hypothetical protein
MSIIHRCHGGANERDPRDHAGPATANHRLGGFEERLLAELKTVVAQQGATATHAQTTRRARRSWPARPPLLTGAAPAAPAARPVGRRRRAGLLAGGLGLTAAGAAAVVAVASAGPAVSGGAPVGRAAARQYLLAAAATAAATPDRPGAYWHVRATMVTTVGKYTVQTWTRPGGRTWADGPARYNFLAPGKGGRRFSLAGLNSMFEHRMLAVPAVSLPRAWGTRYPAGLTIGEIVGYLPFLPINDRANAALAQGAGLVTYRQIQALPASPAALTAWLLAYQRDFTRQTGLPEPEPATLLQSLAELVTAEPAPPQVRAAAFRAMATLPNITSLGPDHGGQMLGVSLGGKQHATLIIERATSQAYGSLALSTGQPGVKSLFITAQWVNRRP